MAARATDFSEVALRSYLSASPVPSAALYIDTVNNSQYQLVFQNDSFTQEHIAIFTALKDHSTVSNGQIITLGQSSWLAVLVEPYIILSLHSSTIPQPKHQETGLYIADAEFFAKKVPMVDDEEQREFLELFSSRLYSAGSPLGKRESWSPILECWVNTILVSPTPCLLCWGPDQILLYNRLYSKSIGQKHPRILGMTYPDAWPEIWDMIDSVVAKAYAGEGTHVINTQMFLQRHNFLEVLIHVLECYFSWSMIPVRDQTGSVIAIFIPNFDGSLSVISERRFKTLQTLGQNLSAVTDYPEFYARAKTALLTNPIDLPLVAMYSTRQTFQGHNDYSFEGSQAGTSDASAMRSDHKSIPLVLNREFIFGCNTTHASFPQEISFDQSVEHESSTNDFASYIRSGCQGTEIIKIPEELVRQELGDVRDATWNERVTHVVVFPICPLDREGTQAVAIVGMNTRRLYDVDSMQFVELLRRQLVAGMAGAMLYTEELRRTQSLAALNLRKNEELKILLDARTRELRETEGKNTRMAEVSRSGLATADARTRKITYANAAWFEISGHPVDENPDEFMLSVHPDDVARAAEVFDRSLSEPTMLEFRWKRPTAEGLDRWCVSLSSPEIDSEGNPVSITYSLSDISDRKKLEELLRKEASDALSRRKQQEYFIDMTSHEMRNPLGAIIHSVDMLNSISFGFQEDLMELIATSPHDRLQKMLVDTEEFLETTKIVGLCSGHMKRLIDDTLTLSKLESDLVVLSPTVFEPRELCATVLKMFDAVFQAEDITVFYKVDEGFDKCSGRFVEADSSRLSQIIINLITNAIKFTAGRPIREIHVTLSCSTERPVLPKYEFKQKEGIDTNTDVKGLTAQEEEVLSHNETPTLPEGEPAEASKDIRYLKISVADSGVGMSRQELGLLFHRFSQIKPRTHSTYDGSGLGLYISKMLSARLGGEVTVESVENEGSTFTFYIEAKTAEANASDVSNLRPMTPSQLQKMAGINGLGNEKLKRLKPKSIQARSSKLLPVATNKSSQPASVMSTSGKPNYRLLVVEDNIINQKIMCKQLTKAGCHITTADNGKEAIDYIITTKFGDINSDIELDLCLMDVEMPIMDGVTACKNIRQMESDGRLLGHLPIIAVTANARTLPAIIATGMDSAVSKPFTWPVLLQEIEKVINVLSTQE